MPPLAKAFTVNPVQRLFSMFPPGAPGTGLLLLRISVAATLVLIVANRTGLSPIHPFFLGALLVSLCIIIGVVTPYVSLIVCVYALVSLFAGSSQLYELVLVSLLLTSAALALLGPGAFSVDARLFGRRVVVVPPRKDADRF
jgi:uncharacterized membrane protein YphA (DoxX/SURF4 family)